ncbi:MAG: glucose-1-phosphate cytidylyltransferase [Desulfobacteraceae bacterium]|nr:glucose-1-phosphate cytidylyltransferase [Desulfobacteraceae bacterium]
MKVGILAGGLGTRLSEETVVKPKPMVEIGGKPILWHIMRSYADYGFKEFVIALGYKGEYIKDYFINYRRRACSLTVNLSSGDLMVHNGHAEDWTVHLLDTGEKTQTGGRVKRIANYIGREPFLLTYGDGVCSVDINKLIEFHRNQAKIATVTAVRPPARFGGLTFDGDAISTFAEKPQTGEGWINGGFFVLEPEIVDYIESDEMPFEYRPMERLTREQQLVAYRHDGFWQCMDTLRDVQLLDNMCAAGNMPWRAKPSAHANRRDAVAAAV